MTSILLYASYNTNLPSKYRSARDTSTDGCLKTQVWCEEQGQCFGWSRGSCNRAIGIWYIEYLSNTQFAINSVNNVTNHCNCKNWLSSSTILSPWLQKLKQPGEWPHVCALLRSEDGDGEPVKIYEVKRTRIAGNFTIICNAFHSNLQCISQ